MAGDVGGFLRIVQALVGLALTLNGLIQLLDVHPDRIKTVRRLLALHQFLLQPRTQYFVLVLGVGLLLPWRLLKTRRALADDLGRLVLEGRKQYVEWVAEDHADEAEGAEHWIIGQPKRLHHG